MAKAYVITGDIIGFTAIPAKKRTKLLADSSALLISWTGGAAYASIFRGDSFQLFFKDMGTALQRSIQLRCWFKKHSEWATKMLDA